MLNTRELLEWQLAAGVDETIGSEPMDYYAASAAAKAAKTAAKATPAPPPSIQNTVAPPVAPPIAAEELLHGACELAAKANNLDQLRQALESFGGCALRKTATNLVFGDGNPKANILFMGDAPGAEEDRQGVPFVGEGGKLLDRMLASIDLNRSKVYISNSVFWRPPGNRTPTVAEMAVCMPFVERMVELLDPEILVTMGDSTAKSMLAQTANISRIRGQWFTYSTPRLPRPIHATPLFHPDYLIKTPAQKRAAWKDLLAIRKKIDP